MIASDPFSQHYAPLLKNTYDVVDRIVINAYFGLAGSGGGFRKWWIDLHGTTDNLDDAHLMRMAGRFSRRCEAVLETPVYDLTVFKIHFGRLTLKIYTKGERVLRSEAIVHNVAELKVRRVIEKFAEVVSQLSAMLDRFLENLQCMDRSWIDHRELEQLPQPSQVGKTRVGGVDINKSRMLAAMRAVLELANSPQGFTAAEHAAKVRELWEDPSMTYTARQSAYDLKKLCSKDLVRKRQARSRRYEPTPHGLHLVAGLHVLREKVLKPLLTYNGRCKSGPKPQHAAELDHRYQAVQREMQQLLKHLNFAA